MTSWNNQTSTLQWNRPRNQKLLKALNRFVFKLPWLFLLPLEDFVGALVLCMLFEFKLRRSPDIFLKPCFVKPKRGNLEVFIVYIYSCGGISVLELLLSLKVLKQCDPRSLRPWAKDLVRRWTCWFHHSFASSETVENEQGVFLRVFVLI